jgi:hypothetical protein
LDKRKKRVHAHYFTNYREFKAIELGGSLTNSDGGNIKNTDCVLNFEKTLYKTLGSGKVKVSLPTKLPLEVESKQSNTILSQDQHLKMLLETEKMDICISTSSLKLLISAIASSTCFEIPIVVKTDRGGNKTVIVDKPLPSVKASTRSRLKSYLKQKTRQLMFGSNEKSLWYNVWRLKSLNVLIRCNVDMNEARGMAVHVKPEYQLERGREMITDGEKIQNWLSGLVKPMADSVTATIDPIKEELIELKPSDQLDPEFTTIYLHSLHGIFTELKQLDGGSFYLCKSRQEDKIHIMSRSSTKNTSGFPSNPLIPMTKPVFEYNGLEWTGTPNQIPGTFPPSYIPQKFIIPFEFCEMYRKNRCKKKCGMAHISHSSLYHLCFDKYSWFEVPGLLPFELGQRDVELKFQ